MRLARMTLTAVLLSFGVLLAGCADGIDMDKLTDFDFLNNKKKLPGDRKPVFPDGVPGVTQGVPPELMKGYQEQEAQTATTGSTDAQGATQKSADAAPTKQAEKPKPKPKPKKVAVRKPAPPPEPQPQMQPEAPPPSQAAQAPWPSAPQPAQPQVAWPDPAPAR
jgi:hypothetical protein